MRVFLVRRTFIIIMYDCYDTTYLGITRLDWPKRVRERNTILIVGCIYYDNQILIIILESIVRKLRHLNVVLSMCQ